MGDEDTRPDPDFPQQSLPEAHDIAPEDGLKHHSQKRM